MNKRIAITLGTLTFTGASTLAGIVGASYPVAIWGVGFAVLYKVFSPQQPAAHIGCPLVGIAATKEGEK